MINDLSSHNQVSLRGVQDHEIQTCVDNFVAAFRALVVKHINVVRSNSTVERTQAALETDVVLDRMNDEARDLIDGYVLELSH